MLLACKWRTMPCYPGGKRMCWIKIKYGRPELSRIISLHCRHAWVFSLQIMNPSWEEKILMEFQFHHNSITPKKKKREGNISRVLVRANHCKNTQLYFTNYSFIVLQRTLQSLKNQGISFLFCFMGNRVVVKLKFH